MDHPSAIRQIEVPGVFAVIGGAGGAAFNSTVFPVVAGGVWAARRAVMKRPQQAARIDHGRNILNPDSSFNLSV